MGQLIKLQDYISRYEQNIFHYPSRFIILKKHQWDKLKYNWEHPLENNALTDSYQIEDWYEGEKDSLLGKIKSIFKRKDQVNVLEDLPAVKDLPQEEALEFNVVLSHYHQTATIDELKQQFLNQLFEFQLTWATSTLLNKSFINKKYYFEEKLKYFLQRFPDTYLVLYKPIFQLKKATIEIENILISPTDIWCIHFVEAGDSAAFISSDKKFWTVRDKNSQEKKIVNPMIALDRTEKIVKSILENDELDLPIHKVLLSRNGYIDFPARPYDVTLIDKRNYEEWFQSLRNLRSPLKAKQLKSAEVLLQYCLTNSMRRAEWE